MVIADINDQAARKTAQAIRTEGGEALAVHTHVSEPASVTAMSPGSSFNSENTMKVASRITGRACSSRLPTM